MTDYIIVTDAAGDISAEMAAANDIRIMPMTFSFSEEESYLHYADFRNYDPHEFYQRLRAGESATTAQVSIGDALAYLQPLLEQGKDILMISFSSGLSGSFNSCHIAVDELLQQFPERRICLLDSLSASMGQGLLVYHGALNRKKGMTLEENAADLQAKRLQLAHWFTVDDLYHLKRGGRCSALSAFMGTMLNIKPVLHVDNEGKLVPVEKVRSHKKALDRMVQIFEHSSLDLSDQPIFISHGDDAEGAERIASLLREKFGVSDISINYIGPIIGAHSGPGTVALFFLAQKR